ncbi:scavenger receptor cysteine-rich domain-containing protein DMBT1-like [Ptychodera flava]|uniref:scavenger receptor cysteine-rich domain-containing protein DMBT1-like n=1 Tax=Ptychodera flava TaxID=63121 RepID=UPI00396A3F54
MRSGMLLANADVRDGASHVEWQLRLSEGLTPFQGRIEVRVNGTWGTVCDKGFDFEDAEVICKNLGFPGAIEAIHGGQTEASRFGAGNGPIWFRDVACTGDETKLSDCSVSPGLFNGIPGLDNPDACLHTEDAAVSCILPEYEGCYSNNVNDGSAVFAGGPNSEATDISDCLKLCREKTYNHASLRNEKECRCGSRLPVRDVEHTLLPNSACRKQCKGSSEQSCDRSTSNVVYNTLLGKCGYEMKSEQGWIVSPDFPGRYPNSLECTWRITTSPGYLVNVTLRMLFLERGYSVFGFKDELTIENLQSMPDNELVLTPESPISGVQDYHIGYTTENGFTVKFKSSYQKNDLGFAIYYNSFRNINCAKSNPCLNDGICSSEGEVDRCICTYGWQGDVCNTHISQCGIHSCSNGGTCQPGTAEGPWTQSHEACNHGHSLRCSNCSLLLFITYFEKPPECVIINRSSSTGIILGAVLGNIALTAAIVMIAFVYYRRRKERKGKCHHHQHDDVESPDGVSFIRRGSNYEDQHQINREDDEVGRPDAEPLRQRESGYHDQHKHRVNTKMARNLLELKSLFKQQIVKNAVNQMI